MTTKRTLTQRALGAVVGSAVGDALGAPFEFRPAGTYGEDFPGPVVGGIGEMIGNHVWQPAEFTDDTQMAIIQARSLLDFNGINGADLFTKFGEWAAHAKDVGIQTRAVLNSGLPWDEAAAAHFAANPHNGAGNGGLMRATPAAVYYACHERGEESMEYARDLAAITHGDPAAHWGAAIYHAMIHAGLHGNDPFVALDAILATLPADQDRFVAMLAPDWTPADTTLRNGTVWMCLAQAVWAVRTTTSFADAIVAAIQLGDDPDTVAAVAGGIAGAIYGIQAIPSRWTTYLHGTITGANGALTLATLQTLVLNLLDPAQLDTPAEVQPAGDPLGPTEIAPGLFAANLAGAEAEDLDTAVISLCRVPDSFSERPVRRAVYLIDQAGDHNAALGDAVRDAVDTVDAFLAEGRRVVVHCYGGASRTGLVLRAWLMRTHGWDVATATAHVRDRWAHLGEWNETFTEFLTNEWLA